MTVMKSWEGRKEKKIQRNLAVRTREEGVGGGEPEFQKEGGRK